MPRLPVDGKKVIEHRITLGTKERSMIESYIFGSNVNQITEPAVELLKDISAMTTITIAFIAFRYGAEIAAQLKGSYDDILELILDVAFVLNNNKVKTAVDLGIRGTPFLGDFYRFFNVIFPGGREF